MSMFKTIADKFNKWDRSLPRGEFDNSLVIRFHRYGTNGETYEPVTYTTHDGIYKVRVPAKFHTDFASVPRAFWWMFPPTGTYARAAVVHDFLYAHKFAFHTIDQDTANLTRKQCDDIFLEAMTANGTKLIPRYLIYWAVRAFGWTRFK